MSLYSLQQFKLLDHDRSYPESVRLEENKTGTGSNMCINVAMYTYFEDRGSREMGRDVWG